MRTRTKKTSNAPRRKSRVIDLVPALLHLNEILVPVDFSPHSKKALRYALAFAQQFGARVTMLHVLDEPSPELAFEPLEKKRFMQAAQESVQKKMNQLLDSEEADVGRHKTKVVKGKPYQEIIRTAQESDADLVVLATHGRTGFKHVVMGSTAEKVVRYATCPVLVVRDKETDFV
jgi:universal stress protein A